MTKTDPRRDNVEYHQGRDARRAGLKADANPYSPTTADPDSRRARWALGHAEGGEERSRFDRLELIANDCLASSHAGTVDRIKRASTEARAAATCEHANARGFYRDAEARELLMAVELEEPELTTTERLIVAALMAAKANGEELELEERRPTRFLIALEGGLVQGTVADRRDVQVTVIDYDDEGADAADIHAIPQSGGGSADALRSSHGEAEYDPAFIDGALAAEIADPERAVGELRTRARRARERGELTYAAELEAEAERLATLIAAEEKELEAVA